MKKTVSILLVLVLALSLFASCSAEKKIIGKWKCDTGLVGPLSVETTFDFKEDGKVAVSTVAGLSLDSSYTINEDTLTIDFGTILGISTVKAYTMNIEKDVLTLTDSEGDTFTLTKVSQ